MGTTALSPLDQIAVRCYTNLIWFFAGSDHAAMLEILRTGLAQIVSELPFLTSDVVPTDTVNQIGQLELRSTDRTLVMGIKDMRTKPGMDYDALRNTNYPLSALDHRDFIPVVGAVDYPDLTAMPALALQANLLSGGLALAVSFNHALCDAAGCFAFAKLWAQACRRISGNASMSETKDYVLSPEAFDRHKVPREPEKIWDEHDKDWSRLPQLDWFQAPPDIPRANSTVEPAVFKFTSEALAAIKQAASPSNCMRPQPKSASASTSSALRALIWLSIVAARSLSPNENNDSTLHLPVSTRARLRPALAPDYFGNTALMIAIKSSFPGPADGKLSMLADLNQTIRQSEQAVDEAHVKNYLSFAGSVPDLRRLARGQEAVYARAVKIFDFTLFDYYGLDWGDGLGRMERARPPAKDLPNGAAVIFPRLPDGSIEVAFGLSPAQMGHLKQDSLFMKYAKAHDEEAELRFGVAEAHNVDIRAKL